MTVYAPNLSPILLFSRLLPHLMQFLDLLFADDLRAPLDTSNRLPQFVHVQK
jgi:hypothetical protein